MVLILTGTACARQEPPPGAVPESQSPRIVELHPARDTVLRELDGPARVRFDEPINAPGDLRGQLRTSPAYRYRTSAGHHGVEIRPEEGWRTGAVYVLVLTGGVTDLLNNRREEPVRWRFSTGPPVTETEVTGTLWDRVSGEQLQEGRAHFLAVEGDSIPYAAVPDSGGRFRLESVPPGRYRAFGFVDRNRNLSLDRRLEPSDSVTFELDGPDARAELQLVLVEPDSTPPVLGPVETRDSVTVRLTFDDYLLPEQELPSDAVGIRRSGAGEELPLAMVRVLTEADREAAAAPPDTAVEVTEDTAAVPSADTAVDVPVDTAAAAPGDTTASPVEVLPTRELEVRTAVPMAPDTYHIRVRGVENLRGLRGGGDTTFVHVRRDTAAAPDTVAAPDTTTPPDTAAVPDTAAPPDTATPPDTAVSP